MNDKYRRILTMLLGAVFLISLGRMAGQMVQYRQASQAQEQALALANATTEAPATLPPTTVAPETEAPTQPPTETVPPTTIPQDPLDPEMEFLLEMDLASLQEVNSDVIGWIHVPGGKISYPLLRSQDNLDYLYHAWDGRSSQSGSIFLECQNSQDLEDFNTILYGHHMADGSFFAPLLHYRQQKHLDKYPFVYILTETKLLRYQVFSAYQAPITSDTFRLYFPDDATRQTALEHYIGSSMVTGSCTPGVEDLILTLATCTGSGNYNLRFTVQAMRTGLWER